MYSTFTSKNREIVERLSRKIDPNASEIGMKQEGLQHKIMDQKYKQAVEKLRIFKTKNERNLLQLSQQLQRIQDTLFTFEKSKNKSSSFQDLNQENFIKLVESQQSENSEKMNMVRKGMIEDIEKKKKTMKADAIEIIQLQFEQMCKSNIIDIEKKLSTVTILLEEERLNKEQSAAYLAESVGEEILKMEQIISLEREERKKQNQSLFDLISDMEEKVQSQIREEIRNREKAQQNLQSRLEQLCYKIEYKILGAN